LLVVEKLALVLVVAGCSAHLDDHDVDGGNRDGNVGGDGSGSDTGVTCANGRTLYLNFEGVTLTKGAPSDAITNRVSWMQNATATVPRYRTNDVNRDGEIVSIINGVKARLAGTPINVVVGRPTSGPYVMIVFGGDQNIVGTIYSYATNEHDCGDPVKSDVGWISDVPSVAIVADLAIGTLGWGLGLNGTNDVNDCMCGWANGCMASAGACTLSASIASTASQSPATTCPNQNPQNELAAFSTGFCQ